MAGLQTGRPSGRLVRKFRKLLCVNAKGVPELENVGNPMLGADRVESRKYLAIPGSWHSRRFPGSRELQNYNKSLYFMIEYYIYRISLLFLYIYGSLYNFKILENPETRWGISDYEILPGTPPTLRKIFLTRLVFSVPRTPFCIIIRQMQIWSTRWPGKVCACEYKNLVANSRCVLSITFSIFSTWIDRFISRYSRTGRLSRSIESAFTENDLLECLAI